MSVKPKQQMTYKADWDEMMCCWCGNLFDPRDRPGEPDWGVGHIETYTNGTGHLCTHCEEWNVLEVVFVGRPYMGKDCL